jgi:hypothetical protein
LREEVARWPDSKFCRVQRLVVDTIHTTRAAQDHGFQQHRDHV